MYGQSSQDLAHLMNTLQKGTVGYQTPLVPQGGSQTASNLSPLVPQQLANTLSIATSSMNDLKLFPMMSKIQAMNTVVEYNRVLNHGAEFDPFISEGGTASLNRSTYEKVAVRIKYLAEKREITDVASFAQLVGPNPDALAEETKRGTETLLRRVEKALFFGDSSLNSLSWDGIIKQIKDGGQVSDLRGKAPTPSYLQEILGHVYSAPYYGMISHILVTPRVLTEMVKQANDNGRHDQLRVRADSAFTYGSMNIFITAPYGEVPVIACPFLERHDRIAPVSGSSSVFEGSVITPTISAQPTDAPNASSQFTANDEGIYYYRVVPVGPSGIGVPVDTNAVDVDAGNKVSFTIAQSDNQATVSSYKIYRSKKDASNADGALFMKEVANAGANTVVEDLNEDIPGGSEIVFINNAPDHMCYYQMLSLVRRPLAQVKTTHPFLLMMFGAPAVKLNQKAFVVKNAGVNVAQGL